jgi:hypothetical protein
MEPRHRRRVQNRPSETVKHVVHYGLLLIKEEYVFVPEGNNTLVLLYRETSVLASKSMHIV